MIGQLKRRPADILFSCQNQALVSCVDFNLSDFDRLTGIRGNRQVLLDFG